MFLTALNLLLDRVELVACDLKRLDKLLFGKLAPANRFLFAQSAFSIL